MKKTKLCLIAVVILSITSCHFEVPERISVKTNAEYNFSIGNLEKSLDDTIKIDEIVSSDKLGIENARVYNYFPGEKDPNVQQFLIKMPLLDIPVDIGEYYRNSGIATAVQAMSFEKEIEIPSIKFENKKDVSMDELNNSLNQLFSFGGVVGNGKAQFAPVFTEVEYESGAIIIEIIAGGGISGVPDGTQVTLNGRTGFFANNKAEIFIDGLVIKQDDVNVSFTTGYEGKPYKGTIKAGSKIKKASGINYDEIDVPVNASIDMPDSFVSAIIKEGSLVADITIPWTGANIDYSITTTGALNVSGKNRINLADKAIASGTLNINAPAKLSFNNATIDFKNSPSVNVKTEIASFKEVVIATDGIDTSLSKEEDFPSDVYDNVKELLLKSSGLKGSYTNTFPEGNDFKIIATSKFFGINNGESVIESQKSDVQFTPIMAPENYSQVINLVAPGNHDPVSNKYGKWDFAMDIVFPKAEGDVNPKHIAVKNVKPGEKYKIALSLIPELNWDYVKISAPDASKADKQSLGINFGSLFTSLQDTLNMDFVSKIRIHKLPVYIRIEKPGVGNSFDNLNISGDVKLFYGKENGAGNIDVIKKNGIDVSKPILSKSDTLKFVSGIPEYKMKGKVLVTDISKYESSVKTDLADLINETLDIADGELYLEYDIGFSGADGLVTVTKEMCESSDSGSISITAFIDIPLQFQVASSTEDLEIDLLSLVGTEANKDLFDRSEPKEVFDFEYLDVIERCRVKYNAKQAPFYSNPDIKLSFVTLPGEEKRETNMKAGEMVIRGNAVRKIFSAESYPYMPEVKLVVPKNAVFSLPRELKIDMNIAFAVNTDGEIDLMGGKK